MAWIHSTFFLVLLSTSDTGLAYQRELKEPPSQATSADRLVMEQVSDLVAAGDRQEAIENLQRLFDQASGRIVAIGAEQAAGTLRSQRYLPLRTWASGRLIELLDDPEARSEYERRVQKNASAALQELSKSKDLAATKLAVARYAATEAGRQLSLLLCDLYLERGWALAAVQQAQHLSSASRTVLPDGSSISRLLTLERAEGSLEGDSTPTEKETPAGDLQRRESESPQKTFEALKRVLIAAQQRPNLVCLQAAMEWAESWSETEGAQSADLSQELQSILAWPRREPQQDRWLTFGGNTARNSVGSRTYDPLPSPKWNQTLERYRSASDRRPASKPPVGESVSGILGYHPVVAEGKVFVNEMHRIVAFDARSGRPWPDLNPSVPLYDSGISPAAFIPLGYPLVGSPRATLTYADGCLFARMGKPVTGWANGERAADGGSLSFLVGLDLPQQGSLLPGFPIRLMPPVFSGAEFEGAPVVTGNRLFVAVVERDNVGLRRHVVAFNRNSGELVWKSPALAAGIVAGSQRANLIANQLLSLAGGRLFYNTNLGAIVCLDPVDGSVEWLSQYNSVNPNEDQAHSPNRFRYRDLTPCLVWKGLVYCAPSDAPEIFALDATSGDLVWSSDAEQTADMIQLLGVWEENLVVGGDRIAWFDRLSGRLQCSFPGAVTPGPANGLPNPRGRGRGVLSGGQVYWPVAGEILVFDAHLQSERRWDVSGQRAKDGTANSNQLPRERGWQSRSSRRQSADAYT